MLNQDFEIGFDRNFEIGFDHDLCKDLWYELNPWVLWQCLYVQLYPIFFKISQVFPTFHLDWSTSDCGRLRWIGCSRDAGVCHRWSSTSSSIFPVMGMVDSVLLLILSRWYWFVILTVDDWWCPTALMLVANMCSFILVCVLFTYGALPMIEWQCNVQWC